MRRHAWRLSAALLLGLGLAQLGGASSPQKGPEAQVQRGLEVYAANYCGTCHTLAAADAHGQFGPSHDHLRAAIEAHLRDPGYRGRAESVADFLRESLLEPEVYRDPAYAGSRYLMPAYTDLSDADLDALVALLDQP